LNNRFTKPKGLNILTNICLYTKISLLKMGTFTVSIPKDLKKKLDEHSEINWAEYLKKRFELRIKELKKFEELKNSGKL